MVGDGAASVQVIPFLTERPDFSDHPPVVRLLEPGLRWGGATDFLVEQGTKVIIRWEAWDDDAIVSQRVLFSPDGLPLDTLAGLGVRRVSCGSLLFRAALRTVVEVLPFQAIAFVPVSIYVGAPATGSIWTALGLQAIWVVKEK